MKKTIIFISFTLLMGVSLSSFAAYTRASVFVSSNFGGSQSDTDMVTLPAGIVATYSLSARAWLVDSPDPNQPSVGSAYATAEINSDISNDIIVEAWAYTPAETLTGTLYCYHHAHTINLYAYAQSSGIGSSNAYATVRW